MTDFQILSGTVFANLAWYRRTKDAAFDPKVHLFENSLAQPPHIFLRYGIKDYTILFS